MAKDTFYFQHDHNARNDRKISALVKDYKSAGYGIFWAACEMMHEEGDRLEFDDLTFDALGKDLNEEVWLIKEVLEKCISKFKLFQIDDILITSNRVKRNLSGRDQKKEAKREAGRLGGISSGLSRKSKQNEAPLQANEAEVEATKHSIVKNSIVNERIEKDRNADFLLWKIYDYSWLEYSGILNGQAKYLNEQKFQKWKDFVDFINKNDFEDIFVAKFCSPIEFGKLYEEKGFTEEKWDAVIKKILATGIMPQHNLFFRIPEFMGYVNKPSNPTPEKSHTNTPVSNDIYDDMKL